MHLFFSHGIMKKMKEFLRNEGYIFLLQRLHDRVFSREYFLRRNNKVHIWSQNSSCVNVYLRVREKQRKILFQRQKNFSMD